MLSQLLYLHKKLENPMAAYQAAFDLYKLEPDDNLLLEMAYASEKLDDKSKAMAHYKAYLDKRFQVKVAMSYYYLLKNELLTKEAEGVLNRVMASDGLSENTRTEVLYELAQLRRTAGRIDEYFRVDGKGYRQERDTTVLYGVCRPALRSGALRRCDSHLHQASRQ